VITTSSREGTIRLGEKLARRLKKNDVVALTGGLGAGKTTLIQGIAKGLGIKNYITSPTFTILNEFKGKLPLFHIDLYRLDEKEFEDIALEEYFDRGGVTVIEWAEKVKDILPENVISVQISTKSDNERVFKIKGISFEMRGAK
jgi:tRNA threonylcarbamoyladenosine biosynthesis protein TsaE